MFEHMAPLAAQDSLTEVVLFGLIGAFLTECSLNATFMRGLSASDVASLFSLPTTQPEKLPQEQQDSGLAAVVTMEKRGGLAEYADLLASVSYHAGAALKGRTFVTVKVDCPRMSPLLIIVFLPPLPPLVQSVGTRT